MWTEHNKYMIEKGDKSPADKRLQVPAHSGETQVNPQEFSDGRAVTAPGKSPLKEVAEFDTGDISAARPIRKFVDEAMKEEGYGDEERMDMVIVVGELVDNAIEHNTPGKKFSVGVGVSAEKTVFRIASPGERVNSKLLALKSRMRQQINKDAVRLC